MTENQESQASGASEARESSERFWHLDRSLKIAFVLTFVVLVFGLAFHKTNYDVHLDAVYGRMIADGGLSSLSEGLSGPATPKTGWLWWLVAYGMMRLGGTEFVAFFAALLVAAGFVMLLLALARRVNIVLAGLVLLAAAYIARPYYVPGSQAAGIFLFGALGALFVTRREGGDRRLWWAVPLVILYVNIDLSWPLAVVFCVVSMLVFARGKRKAILALGVCLAVLANPDFLGVLDWVNLVFPPGSAVGWLSPAVSAATVGKTGAVVLYAVCVGLAVAASRPAGFCFAVAATFALLLGLPVASFPVFVLCSAAGLTAALASVLAAVGKLLRTASAGVACEWIGPLLLTHLRPEEPPAGDDVTWLRLRTLRGLSSLVTAAGLVALLALLATTVAGQDRYEIGWSDDESTLPVEAVSFITREKLDGLALVHPAWAGYLEWRAGVTVVADTRPLAASDARRDAAFWAFTGALGTAAEVLRLLEEWDVAFVLAPQEWPKAHAFREGWKPVYWDDVSAVLVPDTPENAPLVEKYDTSLTYPPLFSVGSTPEETELRVKALAERLQKSPESAYASYELGWCRFALKDYDGARIWLGYATGVKEDFVPAYYLFAETCRADGDNVGATVLYQKVLQYQRDHAMAYLRLGEIFAGQGDWMRGLKYFENARRADDARKQLDLIKPGLRAELDEYIRKITQPAPPGAAEAPQGSSGATEGPKGEAE